jgi:hypothetical protein
MSCGVSADAVTWEELMGGGWLRPSGCFESLELASVAQQYKDLPAQTSAFGMSLLISAAARVPAAARRPGVVQLPAHQAGRAGAHDDHVGVIPRHSPRSLSPGPSLGQKRICVAPSWVRICIPARRPSDGRPGRAMRRVDAAKQQGPEARATSPGSTAYRSESIEARGGMRTSLREHSQKPAISKSPQR